jgi:hypothetical protein
MNEELQRKRAREERYNRSRDENYHVKPKISIGKYERAVQYSQTGESPKRRPSIFSISSK